MADERTARRWAVAVVGVVDNVIKPLLIKAGMEMRSAVVLFALIGGLRAFGAIGLVIGPLQGRLVVQDRPWNGSRERALTTSPDAPR